MKSNAITNKKLFIIALLSVLVPILLCVGTLAFYFAPRERRVEVIEIPSFIGIREEALRDSDSIRLKREWIYSSVEEKGKVISQNPSANSKRKLKSGEVREVTVYIGLGEKLQKVPALEGVDELSAARALREIGANVRSIAIYGEGDDGRVIGTSPTVGQKIKNGDTVTLYVARKRINDTVAVPDFVGMRVVDAARLALSMGLLLDGDSDTDGVIIMQSIPSGSRVPGGSYIGFKVDGGLREWPPVVKKTKRTFNDWKNN